MSLNASMTDFHADRDQIEKAWSNPQLRSDPSTVRSVHRIMEALDQGLLRTAQPSPNGEWSTLEWVKMAVLLYFPLQNSVTIHAGALEFYDKVPLKTGFENRGIRVVPPAVIRYSSFIEPGCIVMPSFVNVGARVGAGTMVDTWATVGSCAQIGRDVHLSGGV